MNDLLGSKKFQAVLVVAIAWLIGKFGLDIDEITLLTILSPILVFIEILAIADIGKEKIKANR